MNGILERINCLRKNMVAVASLFAFAFVFVLVSLNGCGLHFKNDTPGLSHAAGAGAVDLNDSRLVKKKLYAQYREWKGVKYRMGGLNKKGIDCSGFVYLTYRSKFGLKLPRSTELLSQAGIPVKKSQLKTGDLVFFKTSRYVRHVGIYLEKGRFLHASKSKGVIISEMKSKYWRSTYWKAKRIEI